MPSLGMSQRLRLKPLSLSWLVCASWHVPGLFWLLEADLVIVLLTNGETMGDLTASQTHSVDHHPLSDARDSLQLR